VPRFAFGSHHGAIGTSPTTSQFHMEATCRPRSTRHRYGRDLWPYCSQSARRCYCSPSPPLIHSSWYHPLARWNQLKMYVAASKQINKALYQWLSIRLLLSVIITAHFLCVTVKTAAIVPTIYFMKRPYQVQ
jgi:hypothetical protein